MGKNSLFMVVIFGVNVGLKNNTLAGKIKVLELSFGFLNPFSIFVVVVVSCLSFFFFLPCFFLKFFLCLEILFTILPVNRVLLHEEHAFR